MWELSCWHDHILAFVSMDVFAFVSMDVLAFVSIDVLLNMFSINHCRAIVLRSYEGIIMLALYSLHPP